MPNAIDHFCPLHNPEIPAQTIPCGRGSDRERPNSQSPARLVETSPRVPPPGKGTRRRLQSQQFGVRRIHERLDLPQSLAAKHLPRALHAAPASVFSSKGEMIEQSSTAQSAVEFARKYPMRESALSARLLRRAPSRRVSFERPHFPLRPIAIFPRRRRMRRNLPGPLNLPDASAKSRAKSQLLNFSCAS